jgi:hypothetical protein
MTPILSRLDRLEEIVFKMAEQTQQTITGVDRLSVIVTDLAHAVETLDRSQEQFLHMIDDQHLDRMFSRFQFKPKLFLKGREDRRTPKSGTAALSRPGSEACSGVHSSVKS